VEKLRPSQSKEGESERGGKVKKNQTTGGVGKRRNQNPVGEQRGQIKTSIEEYGPRGSNITRKKGNGKVKKGRKSGWALQGSGSCKAYHSEKVPSDVKSPGV